MLMMMMLATTNADHESYFFGDYICTEKIPIGDVEENVPHFFFKEGLYIFVPDVTYMCNGYQ